MAEQIRFEVTVTLDKNGSPVETAIGCDHPAHPAVFAASVCAAEHFMTAVCTTSEVGFDKALDLLCDGARSNKIKWLSGHPIQ